ncbi:MAG: xanthine phosphoribosyltransferase, partial [Acholeplasmatales bacterium]|nr:xanthine phosphoribosyltransferase [Acholeplasmatales bacterium]
GGKRLRSKGIRVESLAKIEEIDLEERKVKFCLE